MFRTLTPHTSIESVRRACLDGQLLRHGASETRHRIWDALNWRYFAWHPPRWVLADLAGSARGDSTDVRFIGLAYLHYARRDRLTFDFVADKLWSLWKTGIRTVARDDVMDFLAEMAEAHGMKRWRDSTRKKLAGNMLSALRDFGLLTGVQHKTIQRPIVAPEVALHLCRLLEAEGLRGRSLIEARDWRLLLWEQHDTSQALARLAQDGAIRFERSGRTVVLELPAHPVGS